MDPSSTRPVVVPVTRSFDRLEEVERQVELGGGAARRIVQDSVDDVTVRVSQVGAAVVAVLVGEHHLEQRVAGGGPDRIDDLDDPFERQVLVAEGGEVGLPEAVDELREGRIAGQVRPQNEGVDEEADEPLEGGVVPPGHRYAEGDVLPGAEAGQQTGHGGVDDHERGGARRLRPGRRPARRYPPGA